MILQTVNFSDLLSVDFGFRVRTSQKCIFLFFSLFFILNSVFFYCSSAYLHRFSHRSTHFLWVFLSLGGEC